MNRKQFLKTAGLGGASFLATPFLLDQTLNVMKRKHDYRNAFGLVRSLTEEYTYQPEIKGKIPVEVRGTLFRNGPGLFERNGYRKENILDGDGMVQAFRFTDGKVSYRNRFVRTRKWLDEEVAGKYLYNTWTTRRPGGMLKNAFMQGEFHGQAGVSVRVINGRLFAFDESSRPYELDPVTLETIAGELDFDVHFDNINTLFAAHSKVDGQTGEWIQFGLENGLKANIQVSIFDHRITLKRSKRYELPLGTYMHDFFVSENYIVFNLQPAVMNPLPFIFGKASYAESLRWKKQNGSTLMVIHKSLQQAPVYLTTEAVWMWHSLNTFEMGDEILGYFIGYDEPDHFIGKHAQTYEIMEHNASIEQVDNAKSPGTLRLFRINLRDKKVHSETVAETPGQSFEFPVINETFMSRRNRFGYMASGTMMGAFHHQINRIDIQTGKRETYDFGAGFYCGEPIFVPHPDHTYHSGSREEPGWIMSLVYHEQTDKSFIALLKADRISEGPIATVHLRHHSPMSFHGHWSA